MITTLLETVTIISVIALEVVRTDVDKAVVTVDAAKEIATTEMVDVFLLVVVILAWVEVRLVTLASVVNALDLVMVVLDLVMDVLASVMAALALVVVSLALVVVSLALVVLLEDLEDLLSSLLPHHFLVASLPFIMIMTEDLMAQATDQATILATQILATTIHATQILVAPTLATQILVALILATQILVAPTLATQILVAPTLADMILDTPTASDNFETTI